MKKILIADASTLTRVLVERELGSEFTIENVSTGTKARSLLDSNNYDLLLLDADLPEYNGIKMIQYLAKTNKLSHIPVILMGTNNDPAIIEAGFIAGANDYIIKQFSIAELHARINNQFRIQELNRILGNLQKLDTVKSLILTLKHEIVNALTNISALNDLSAMKKGGSEESARIEENINRIVALLNKVDELNSISFVNYTGSIPQRMLKI